MLWILELLEGLLSVGSHEGLADAIESYGQRRDDAKADAAWADERKGLAAHAQADILVLAALHDGVITRTERKDLAAILPSLLARADVETTPEVLVERWNARQESIESDQDLSRTIESLAHWLTAPQKSRLFDAIVQLNRADASGDSPPTGPYRGSVSATVASTIRLFGNALCIDEARIGRAENR
jgi:hypothetical protein